AILRTSSLPSMLHLLQYNAHRGAAARLFEIGKIYEMDAGGRPLERAVLTLGACAAGAATLDFRALRGEVEAVLAAFALPPHTCAPAENDAALDPAGAIVGPGEPAGLARLGRLRPALAEAWKLPPETWLAEIDLERCYRAGAKPTNFEPPSRYPSSERDFSFLFADEVRWAQVAAALASPPIPWLVDLQPAEIYRGPNLESGHYSLLLRARFQSHERTLTDPEVQSSAAEIIHRLQSLGGRQR
ncbi:MAG: hypothetical protein ACRD1Y_03735, partial [Terriglobales bacterium]